MLKKNKEKSNKELKEYRLSIRIDIHDFETRTKNAEEYLLKGHKIKASIRLKGREMGRPERAIDVLNKFSDALRK
jgi:translation initiation factor IF-3